MTVLTRCSSGKLSPFAYKAVVYMPRSVKDGFALSSWLHLQQVLKLGYKKSDTASLLTAFQGCLFFVYTGRKLETTEQYPQMMGKKNISKILPNFVL